MVNVINTLTNEEIAAIHLRIALKKTREERACVWCDKPVMMLANQRFCCTACRTKYSQAAAVIEHERLVIEATRWAEERAGLVQEIADLRRQLLATKD